MTDDFPLNNLPATRAEAKRTGSRYYFTGIECKRGHVDARLASNASCLSCHSEYGRQWKQDNAEKELERKRKWRHEHPDRERDFQRNWYQSNLERDRDRNREWRQSNPGRNREIHATRHAAKLQRTPAWSDRESIRLVYEEADRLTSETGIAHHVDHFYPLQGNTVSGLHVADNLRAIPAYMNMSKHNLHPEEYNDSLTAAAPTDGRE